MGLTYYRIYKGPLKSYGRRVLKGRKKKYRRIDRADKKDGWARKRANGLAPMFRPSKKYLEYDLKSWGM